MAQAEGKQCWETPAWKELEKHVGAVAATHLRDLLKVRSTLTAAVYTVRIHK